MLKQKASIKNSIYKKPSALSSVSGFRRDVLIYLTAAQLNDHVSRQSAKGIQEHVTKALRQAQSVLHTQVVFVLSLCENFRHKPKKTA